MLEARLPDLGPQEGRTVDGLEDVLHQVLALQTAAEIVVGPSPNEIGRLEMQGSDGSVLAGRPVLAGNGSQPLSVHGLVRRELMPRDPKGTDAVRAQCGTLGCSTC